MIGHRGASGGGWQFRLSGGVGAPAVFSLVISILIGCNQGPPAVDVPNWDPPYLAGRIMSELDKNGDAQVDDKEVAAAPGLAAGARFVDKDKNGKLSHEELEARFEIYVKYAVGLQPQIFRVTYRGRPVRDAELVFQPEPFLDGLIEPARGTTDQDGMVTPQTEGQELPGMRTGYYRVQITSVQGRPVGSVMELKSGSNRMQMTSGQVSIPAKYTSAAILGAEASPIDDDPFGPGGVPELRLTD